MWYFILALLFGTPSNTDTNDNQTVSYAQSNDYETGTGGGAGPVRPGK